MRKIFILGALGALLGGCAGVYDAGAVPAAKGALDLAKEQCTAARKATLGETNAQYTECLLAADRAFAVAVKLNDMRLFENYAARMRLAASQRDAGLITREEMQARANQFFNDYVASIDRAAAVDQARRAQAAAALAGVAAAANAEADREAYIQAHNPTVNCTSTTFGSTVNTTCN